MFRNDKNRVRDMKKEMLRLHEEIEELADAAVGRMERTTVRFDMKEDGYAGADQKMAGRA